MALSFGIVVGCDALCRTGAVNNGDWSPYVSLGSESGVSMWLEFVGERVDAESGREVTFGRDADLVLDEDNRYLHRVAGVFRHSNGVWWLHNEADWGDLELISDDGTRHVVPPSAYVAVVRGGEVRLKAGKAKFALTVGVDLGTMRWDGPVAVTKKGPTTARFGVVTLNTEQRQLLAALAEPRILSESSETSLPSNKSVANRLDWSRTKFNRKLDYLCQRLTQQGVRGLVGPKGADAVDRRARLVEHVLEAGMITEADLDLLP